MRYRQSLMQYATKYSVSRVSRKYNKSRSYIYYWKARWDGSMESLACHYCRYYNFLGHLKQHQQSLGRLLHSYSWCCYNFCCSWKGKVMEFTHSMDWDICIRSAMDKGKSKKLPSDPVRIHTADWVILAVQIHIATYCRKAFHCLLPQDHPR